MSKRLEVFEKSEKYLFSKIASFYFLLRISEAEIAYLLEVLVHQLQTLGLSIPSSLLEKSSYSLLKIGPVLLLGRM